MDNWQKSYFFNIDLWYPLASNIPSLPKTRFIPLTKTDAICLLKGRGFKKLLQPVKKRVDDELNGGCRFFKLSTRSGKDAYEVLDPSLDIKEDDSSEELARKIQAQIEILKVSSFEDVYRIIRASKRLKEDLTNYIDYATDDQSMSIVLQEWKPCKGTEYRCFIKGKRLIAFCLYHGCQESLDDDDGLRKEIEEFIQNIQPYIQFEDYVLDIDLESRQRIRFIELNPFNDETDPCIFTWEELRNKT